MKRDALCALLLLAAAPLPAEAAGRTYAVDPAESALTVKVDKAGLFSFAGHVHGVTVLSFRGEVVADPDDCSASSVALTFETASITVTSSEGPAADIPKIQETMAGPKLLDVARFPAAEFSSRTVTGKKVGEAAWEIVVTGELRMRGVARTFNLPMHVELSGDTLLATGRTVLRQTDFGMQPVSVGGVVKVKNELTVDYKIRARASP